MTDLIRTELDQDGILLASLNRPEVMNAINDEMWILCKCHRDILFVNNKVQRLTFHLHHRLLSESAV